MTLDLGHHAAVELRGREVAAGWPDEDVAAWRTIAALFGEGVDGVGDWAPLVTAARTAEDRRHAAFLAATEPDRRAAIGLRWAALSRIRHAIELRAIRAGQMPKFEQPTRIAA